MKRHATSAPLVLLALAVGCSDYDYKSSDEGAYWSDTGYPSEDGDWGGDGGGGSDGGDPDDGWEPEEEDDFLSLRPAPTDAYVFVANPNRDGPSE